MAEKLIKWDEFLEYDTAIKNYIDTNGTTYTPAKLGFGYATCSTAASTTAKTATLSNYELVTNSTVSVKFTYNVPASATLNINSKGAKTIYYKGSPIKANIIKAGDIATFIYNGTYYHLLSVDNTSIQEITGETVTETPTNTFSNRWEKSNQITGSTNLNSHLVYGNNTFLINSANYRIYYSDDILNWTESLNLADIITSSSDNVAIAFGNSTFVATAYRNTYYSTSGKTWAQGTQLSFSGGGWINDVCFGNSTFVAVGGLSSGGVGRFFYSRDNGKNWTESTNNVSSDPIYKVAFGNSRFIAFANSGKCYYSTNNGVNWSAGGTVGSTKIRSIAYGQNKFIAINTAGDMYYSTDNGISWTYHGKIADATNLARFITFANNLFMVTTSKGNIYTSIDGSSWNNYFTVSSSSLYDIAYVQGIVAVVNGNIGNVLFSSFKKNYSIQTTTTEKSIKEAVNEIYNNSKINTKTLKAGLTIITIPDSRITTDSILSFYTSKYGVNPIEVEVNNQSVTLVFTAQDTDMEVGVSVDG